MGDLHATTLKRACVDLTLVVLVEESCMLSLAGEVQFVGFEQLNLKIAKWIDDVLRNCAL